MAILNDIRKHGIFLIIIIALALFSFVLSGVIGGLMGQGLSPLAAAQKAVVFHAYAGDQAARQGQRGMIATDVIPIIRMLVG